MNLEQKTTRWAGWKRILYAALAFAAVAFIYNFQGQVEAYRQKRDLEKTFREYSHAISRGTIARPTHSATRLFEKQLTPRSSKLSSAHSSLSSAR